MNVLLRKLKGAAAILACLPRGEIASFLYLVSSHVPDWLFKFNRGMILSSPSPRLPTRENPRFTFGQATPDDFDEISDFSGVPRAALQQRVANGDWGYVTRDSENKNRIVSVQWIHTGPCFVRGYGLLLDIPETSAYIYGALSAPEVRLLGVFNSAFQRVCHILKDEGIDTIVGLVEFFNKSAYNYHLRSNFTDIATVTYVSIFGIKFSTWKPADSGRRKIRGYLTRPRRIPWI